MDVLDAIINAHDGAAVRQLGSQFGLDEPQAATALGALVPALAAGFQRNLRSEGGLGSLLAALTAGQHQQYLDHPEILAGSTAVQDGNGILGHVFGSKDVSREVASRAAQQTGLSADLLKKMLPLAAALMMGAFARSSSGTSPASSPRELGGGTDIMSLLTPLLDSNRNGSILDEVTGLLGRFVGR
jgi:hypothetical protein